MSKRLLYVSLGAGMIVLVLFISWFFLKSGGLVEVPASPPSSQVSTSTQSSTGAFQYIQIYNACDWKSVGSCVNMRSGAGTQFPIVGRLRDGVVLKTSGGVVVNGQTWYKIIFGTELRFPERVKGELFVAAGDSVKLFRDQGDLFASEVSTTTTKHILVDISQEMLYAYEGENVYMQVSISTGLEFTPTPNGTFYVYKKTPTRYMQGPIPGVSSQYYDLPGVPWDLYFTKDGAVIHGAYWHDKFGEPWSHGCVNLSPENAEKLYRWADIGMPIIVKN